MTRAQAKRFARSAAATFLARDADGADFDAYPYEAQEMIREELRDLAARLATGRLIPAVPA